MNWHAFIAVLVGVVGIPLLTVVLSALFVGAKARDEGDAQAAEEIAVRQARTQLWGREHL